MSPNQPGQARPAQKEDFLDAVAVRLGVADAPAIQMIMVGFEALRDTELREKLGDDAMQDVRSSIVGALTEVAADGQVCRLDATSYGVLSPIDLDQDQMIATVAEATDEFGVSESDLGTAVESVELDVDADAEPEDLRGLLSHTAHKFYQTVRKGTPFGTAKISEVSEEIAQAIQLIETALERGDISVTSREVRRITDGGISLYLAHGALVVGNEIVPADQLLAMEDHPELAGRHDRYMVAIALETFGQADPSTPVIVDFALPTLESG